MPDREKLFEQFPPISTEEWMDKIKLTLKVLTFNKKLVWKTGMGFDVMPFYRKEDIEESEIYQFPSGRISVYQGKKDQ